VDNLSQWLPTVVAAGGIGLLWYDVRRGRSEWKKALYREDGTPNYITRAECKEEQTACQQHLCGKINEMRLKLDAMDNRRELQRDVISKELSNLTAKIEGLTSRLDEYIRSHK
jgi:hypothetical protein